MHSQAGATQFFEAVESGFKAKREKSLKPLFEAIEAGSIGRLLVTDLSRAARREKLLDQLITLCDEHGVEFLAGGMTMSHDNAYSWFSAKQMQLQAELYSRDLSQRIRRGQAAAVARGIPAFTSRHLSWHLRRIEGTKHGVEPHPERWDDARKAVMAYATGEWSMDALCEFINPRHGVLRHASAALKWLKRPQLRGHYANANGAQTSNTKP